MVTAAIAGGLAVAMGAFGAHGLARIWTPARLATYQTAVLYHLVHALALGLVGAWAQHAPRAAMTLAGGLLAGGLALFSGSLYALAFFGVGAFGALAPVGGLLLIGGWGALAWGAWTG